jgi:hypothetical protein
MSQSITKDNDMASSRQIAANKRNSLKSTGPQSDNGKAISRRNAMSHGLTADRLFLNGENPAVFERLREDLMIEFAPATTYETELTDRIAALVWRLRRIAPFEAAILAWMAYRQVENFDQTNLRVISSHRGLPTAQDGNDGPAREQLRFGRMLEAEMKHNLTAKLGRYEAHLMRQLKATRTELAECQTARAEREMPELPSPTLVRSTPQDAKMANAPASAKALAATNIPSGPIRLD